MLWITLVLLIVGEAFAQIQFPGKCPAFKTVPNFDVKRFMGKWYDAANYTTAPKLYYKCATGTYTLNQDGTVNLKITKKIAATGQVSNFNAVLTRTGGSGSATFTAKFSETSALDGTYSILATEYQTWAVIYSCANPKGSSIRFSRILTRAANPSKAVLKNAFAAAAMNNLKESNYRLLDQKNCGY